MGAVLLLVSSRWVWRVDAEVKLVGEERLLVRRRALGGTANQSPESQQARSGTCTQQHRKINRARPITREDPNRESARYECCFPGAHFVDSSSLPFLLLNLPSPKQSYICSSTPSDFNYLTTASLLPSNIITTTPPISSTVTHNGAYQADCP